VGVDSKQDLRKGLNIGPGVDQHWGIDILVQRVLRFKALFKNKPKNQLVHVGRVTIKRKT